MSNQEQRTNDEFRRQLQQRWVDEATTSRRPAPVDGEQLWRKIEAQVAREAGGAPVGWRRAASLVAAATALIVMAVVGGGYLGRGPAMLPMAGVAAPRAVEVAAEGPRQSLLQPWKSSCDVTRQSCEMRTSLASGF